MTPQTLMQQACEQACRAIAPAWPLDRAIAVNPHWFRVGEPVRRVAARMALLGGVRVFPSRPHFQQAWNRQRITPEDLEQAMARSDTARSRAWNEAACVEALARPLDIEPLPLLIDVLDNAPNRAHRLPWRQAVTHQISQTCAAYFDQHQADWQPQREQGLYAFWRDTLLHDLGISVLMGLPDLKQRLTHLPATPELAEQWACEKLGLPDDAWPRYLEGLLLSINGWASWCAYLQWQAALGGGADAHLRQLLAIRLAWGILLLDGKDAADTERPLADLRARWSGADGALARAEEALVVEELWQQALEIGYQRPLAQQLTQAGQAAALSADATAKVPVQVQAAFCIDVRSEPLRRALEAAGGAGVQTLGFAGFFGLPMAYTPLGTAATRPQLPGLLAPQMEARDTIVTPAGSTAPVPGLPEVTQARQRRLSFSEQWHAASRWPASAFSFVEAFGWAHGLFLSKWLRSPPQARARDDLQGLPARLRPLCRPSLAHLDAATRIDLAARVLRAMGLVQALAPLVLLVGHGSQSRNNPQAAALDCGACCGQTGEVNARVLAQMLNDPAVRAGLPAHGIHVPPTTAFVAALHNTTTDELEWFDLDLLDEPARQRVAAFQPTADRALDQVRRERMPRLQLQAPTDAKALLHALQRRASDGAQTRPEWGLAGNAAFVIAPRAATRGLNLHGRSFLHDYDAAQDADGSLLELLMTAPMLVTHWINWQYHASTCEPALYGSGNKVLHNVVGGHIGVFEGNGGDLRIGLSKQSLHDGTQWVHEPLRLTVAIAAPRARIEAVIDKHAVVRQLVDHGWLHLWQLEADGVWRYDAEGAWCAVESDASPVTP